MRATYSRISLRPELANLRLPRDISVSHVSRKVAVAGRNNLKKLTPSKRKCIENLLFLLSLVSITLGILLGLAFNGQLTGKKYFNSLIGQFIYDVHPGELYLRLLKGFIFPMVISANVSNMVSLTSSAARYMGMWTCIYFVSMLLCAETIAIVIGVVVKPGRSHDIIEDRYEVSDTDAGTNSIMAFLILIKTLIPDNIITAIFESDTENEWKENVQAMSERYLAQNVSNQTAPPDQSQLFPKQPNVLGLIFFSLVFGVAVRKLGDEVAPLAEAFYNLRRVMVYLVSIVVWFAPLGILFLVAAEVSKMEDVQRTFANYLLFVLCELGGLAIHTFLVLPLVLYAVTRRSPVEYFLNMSQSLTTAFGTSSSTAALPLTLQCLEERNGLDSRVARFVIPLGTTLNMHGTALHQVLAAIYFAQAEQRRVATPQYFMLAACAILTSIATPAMPSASIYTSGVVLQTLGVPSEDMLKLAASIDWILDRFRTICNIFGNAIGTAVVAKMVEPKLATWRDEDFPDLYGRMCIDPPDFDRVTELEESQGRTRRRFYYRWDLQPQEGGSEHAGVYRNLEDIV